MEVLLNIALTAVLLSVVLWISKTNPILGGFIVSLPLSTLIVLALAKIQNQDPGNTMILAKSIFLGVPSTLVFFVPFLFAEKFKLSFWNSYFLGFALLSCSFFVHRWAMNHWVK